MLFLADEVEAAGSRRNIYRAGEKREALERALADNSFLLAFDVSPHVASIITAINCCLGGPTYVPPVEPMKMPESFFQLPRHRPATIALTSLPGIDYQNVAPSNNDRTANLTAMP